MDTPGYDPVSATGQVAGGANVLCFTTGRGSAYGCKPTPSIKLATNSDIYRRMIDDMDINCGDVLDGVSIEEKGQEIFDKILAVASGERSKSEELGYGVERVRALADRRHDVTGRTSRPRFTQPASPRCAARAFARTPTMPRPTARPRRGTGHREARPERLAR